MAWLSPARAWRGWPVGAEPDETPQRVAVKVEAGSGQAGRLFGQKELVDGAAQRVGIGPDQVQLDRARRHRIPLLKSHLEYTMQGGYKPGSNEPGKCENFIGKAHEFG